MFATAQLCDTSERVNVPVTNFKNFDPANVKKNQKYKLKVDGIVKDAVVLHVAETLIELEEHIKKKRLAPPPLNSLVSASESSSAEEEVDNVLHFTLKTNKRIMGLQDKKSILTKNDKSELKMKGEGYAKIRRGRPTKHKETIIESFKTTATASSANQKRPTNLVETLGLSKLKTQTDGNALISERKKVSSTENPEIFKKPLNPNELIKKGSQENNAIISKTMQQSQSFIKPTTSLSKNVDKNESRQHACDHVCLKKLESLQNKIANMSQKVKDMENVLQKKEEEIQNKEKRLKEASRSLESRKLIIIQKETELTEIRTLNRQLQAATVEKFEYIKEMFMEEKEKKENGLDKIDYELKPGDQDETKKMIYISRGEWMGLDTFRLSTDNVKTYSQVAKNLAVAIFGFRTLQQGTISGKASNRSKDKTNPVQKLDAKKMLCLKEVFKYYLKDVLKINEEIVDEQLDKVRMYVGKKIADLKKNGKKDVNEMGDKDENNGLQLQNKNEIGNVQDLKKSSQPVSEVDTQNAVSQVDGIVPEALAEFPETDSNFSNKNDSFQEDNSNGSDSFHDNNSNGSDSFHDDNSHEEDSFQEKPLNFLTDEDKENCYSFEYVDTLNVENTNDIELPQNILIDILYSESKNPMNN